MTDFILATSWKDAQDDQWMCKLLKWRHLLKKMFFFLNKVWVSDTVGKQRWHNYLRIISYHESINLLRGTGASWENRIGNLISFSPYLSTGLEWFLVRSYYRKKMKDWREFIFRVGKVCPGEPPAGQRINFSPL